MRNLLSLTTLVLAVAATGCGDSPQNVLRDYITLRNEIADEALRVTDEASAKATIEGRFKKLKDRQEWIKKRLDKIKDSRKLVEEFAAAQNDVKGEMEAGAVYLARAEKWIETVRDQSSGSAAVFSQVIGEMKGLSDFTLPQPQGNSTTSSGGAGKYGGQPGQ